MAVLPWQLARDKQYRQECWLTNDFCLLIEPTDKSLTMHRVAVIRNSGYVALYRSQRLWPVEEAKVEALKAGLRVAKREEKIHAQIADLLKRKIKEVR